MEKSKSKMEFGVIISLYIMIFVLNENPHVEIICADGGCGIAPMIDAVTRILRKGHSRKDIFNDKF